LVVLTHELPQHVRPVEQAGVATSPFIRVPHVVHDQLVRMKRIFVAITLAALSCNPVSAQTGAIVLKMSASTEADAKQMITIALLSGQKITISMLDVDVQKTYAANGIQGANGIQPKDQRPAVTQLPAVESSSSSTPSNIRSKCEAQWGTDVKMRLYCEEQQKEAMAAIGRRVMTSTDQEAIRIRCQDQWRDDYKMQNVCEEQQLKAMGQLGRE
jgi:hypothetical protein